VIDTLAIDEAPAEASERSGADIQLSVIVPARNEADCITECLISLAAQSDEGFVLGEDWELIVVDDGSTDATRELARGVGGATVIAAAPPQKGWTGKANACWTGAKRARGTWLLFTDADTVHEPGDLRRAMHEAERTGAKLLSYSPRQIVSGFWQHALMPLIFSDLARTYPPAMVSNPQSAVAAANGQFLMIERGAYQRSGGHAAVAASLLEDVAIARNVKRAAAIRFRYAPDAVCTRMYRSFGAMVEGWTKNLALLFPSPLLLAFYRVLDLCLLIGLPVLAWKLAVVPQKIIVILWWLWRAGLYVTRVGKSNFPMRDCVLSIAALPLYAALLCRSWMVHKITKRVEWKGRSYSA